MDEVGGIQIGILVISRIMFYLLRLRMKIIKKYLRTNT